MTDMYILDKDNKVVPVNNTLTWATWYEKHNSTVAWTTINKKVYVSTMFLGLDHNFSKEGPPLVFETMVFGDPDDQDMKRYSTWDEAVAGHDEMVEAEMKKRKVNKAC